MRRSFNNKVSILSAILALTGGIDPTTGKEKKPIKQRYVPGDNFYNSLRYKRVNGKMKVAGDFKSKYQEPVYLDFPAPIKRKTVSVDLETIH